MYDIVWFVCDRHVAEVRWKLGFGILVLWLYRCRGQEISDVPLHRTSELECIMLRCTDYNYSDLNMLAMSQS